MNTLVRDFYRTQGTGEAIFYEVLFLTEHETSWNEASQKCPALPRGWFELCRLSLEDRIEFVREFWVNFLPYHPNFHQSLAEFFDKIDDISVVLSQVKKQGPWAVDMVYSLKDNQSFFRGLPPCSESQLDELRSRVEMVLPHDYLSFLKVHNGFGKLSDLGLMKIESVLKAKERIIDQFLWAERSLMMGNQAIDPNTLIPFYESSGLGSYQCFYTEWYPGSEMGNVYLSSIDSTISDYTDRKGWTDQLAFPSFLDWLAYYLEGNSVD